MSSDSRKIGEDDPTAEQKEVEFDGRQTLQLDDTYRILVPSSESETGCVDRDDRGQAKWKWKAEMSTPADPLAATFNYLNPLNSDLALEETQTVAEPELPPKAAGFNPYEAGVPLKRAAEVKGEQGKPAAVTAQKTKASKPRLL
jgi:hypothetical protein